MNTRLKSTIYNIPITELFKGSINDDIYPIIGHYPLTLPLLYVTITAYLVSWYTVAIIFKPDLRYTKLMLVYLWTDHTCYHRPLYIAMQHVCPSIHCNVQNY